MSIQKALFKKILPLLGEERCKTCECLQGALLQIELDADSETAASALAYRTSAEQMHS